MEGGEGGGRKEWRKIRVDGGKGEGRRGWRKKRVEEDESEGRKGWRKERVGAGLVRKCEKERFKKGEGG